MLLADANGTARLAKYALESHSANITLMFHHRSAALYSSPNDNLPFPINGPSDGDKMEQRRASAAPG